MRQQASPSVHLHKYRRRRKSSRHRHHRRGPSTPLTCHLSPSPGQHHLMIISPLGISYASACISIHMVSAPFRSPFLAKSSALSSFACSQHRLVTHHPLPHGRADPRSDLHGASVRTRTAPLCNCQDAHHDLRLDWAGASEYRRPISPSRRPTSPSRRPNSPSRRPIQTGCHVTINVHARLTILLPTIHRHSHPRPDRLRRLASPLWSYLVCWRRCHASASLTSTPPPLSRSRRRSPPLEPRELAPRP